MGPGAILSKNSSSGSQPNLYMAPEIQRQMLKMNAPERQDLMAALTRLGILNVGGNDSNMSLHRDEDEPQGMDYSMPDQSQLYTEPQGQNIGF